MPTPNQKADTLRVQSIAIESIAPGDNDRKRFNEESLKELAESISTHGLAQPIILRKTAPKRYEIVAGERRFRAHKLLGLPTIQALVRDYGDEQASAVMLTENTSRADLGPIEEANAYRRRIEDWNWDIERVAKEAGVSKGRVEKRLSLLGVLPHLHVMINTGAIPIGHAELMSKLDLDRQMFALRIFNSSGGEMTFPKFKEVVERFKAEQDQEGLFALEFELISETAPGESDWRQDAVNLIPVDHRIPVIATKGTDTSSDVIERFITQLQALGMEQEALTASTLYKLLVTTNMARIPVNTKYTNKRSKTA